MYKNVQLDAVALSLHIAAGECALKNYLVVQVEEKRSSSVGEESEVKTDTSFTAMCPSPPPGQRTTQRCEGALCMEQYSKMENPSYSILYIFILFIHLF